MRIRPANAANRFAAGAALACLAVAGLAGCGSDDSSTATGGTGDSATGDSGTADSSACSAAEEALAPWTGVPTTLPEGLTPLSEPAAADGYIINLAKAPVPSDIQAAKAMEQAAEVLGWKFKTLTFDGTVEDGAAKMLQAAEESPTMITVSSMDPGALSVPLAKAKENGVVVAISSIPQEPTDFPGYAAEAVGLSNFETIGEILGNWAITDSGCDAHVATVPLAGFEQLEREAEVVGETLAANCEDCSTETVPVQVTDMGSPAMASAIVSALQANPDINYVAITVGNMATGLDAALRQAGLSDKVKIIGAVPDPAAFEALANGTNAMWVNYSPDMNSWALVDAALRAIDTQAPATDLPFPLSVVTKTELPEGYESGAITYPLDYPDEFAALWGR